MDLVLPMSFIVFAALGLVMVVATRKHNFTVSFKRQMLFRCKKLISVFNVVNVLFHSRINLFSLIL